MKPIEWRMIRRPACMGSKSCRKAAEHRVTYKQRKNQRWPVTEHLCEYHHKKRMQVLRRGKKFFDVNSWEIVVIDPETKEVLDDAANG